MKRLDGHLVDLAYELVHGNNKTIDFDDDDDYRGELTLWWEFGKFHAYLVILSDPVYTPGTYYQPPETEWREEEEEFEAVKIQAVADWLKGYGFEL